MKGKKAKHTGGGIRFIFAGANAVGRGCLVRCGKVRRGASSLSASDGTTAGAGSAADDPCRTI